MTDEEIRRRVLADAGLQPDEVDRYLAQHPKPMTMFEQSAILGERIRDLGQAVWQERRPLAHYLVTAWLIAEVAVLAWVLLP